MECQLHECCLLSVPRHQSGGPWTLRLCTHSVHATVVIVNDCCMCRQVLARGERIENLVDKTDNLRNQADRFHRTGVALRRKMWWQHKKMWLIVILIILILALVIFLSVCFSGGNCFKN